MSEHPEQPMLPPEEPYLWDGSGPADPTVASVERELAALRVGTLARLPMKRRGARLALAAAAIALLAIGWWWLSPRSSPAPVQATLGPWHLKESLGVQVGPGMVMADYPSKWARRVEAVGKIPVELSTMQGSRLVLQSGAVLDLPGAGVDPFVVVQAGRVEVIAGSGDVVSLFVDNRPFTVHPDSRMWVERASKGVGRIRVETGWVDLTQAVQRYKAEPPPLRMAAGDWVAVATLEEFQFLGEGLPPRMLKALDSVLSEKSGGVDEKQQWNAMSELLDAANRDSAPMLWNLAWRVPEALRERVIARLDELVPAKHKWSREQRVELDWQAMDELWLAIVTSAEDSRRKGK